MATYAINYYKRTNTAPAPEEKLVDADDVEHDGTLLIFRDSAGKVSHMEPLAGIKSVMCIRRDAEPPSDMAALG